MPAALQHQAPQWHCCHHLLPGMKMSVSWWLKHSQNKVFIDINATSHASLYGLLQTNITSSIKPEVHNVSQRRHRRTEPQPQGICKTNFVQIGPVVPEICSWTDRHTDRQTDRNTLLPYPGGVIMSLHFNTASNFLGSRCNTLVIFRSSVVFT